LKWLMERILVLHGNRYSRYHSLRCVLSGLARKAGSAWRLYL
jgi:hypothetical protein